MVCRPLKYSIPRRTTQLKAALSKVCQPPRLSSKKATAGWSNSHQGEVDIAAMRSRTLRNKNDLLHHQLSTNPPSCSRARRCARSANCPCLVSSWRTRKLG